MDRKSLPVVLAFALIAVAASPRSVAVCEPVFTGPTTIADLGTNNRAWGIAAGDFDEDGNVDVVAGRSLGQIFFIKGNGDGTFAAATQYAWKQAAFNAWAFSAADVDGDHHLDIVWGSSANSPSAAPFVVSDGEVRVFYGNGDGTFVQNPYSISGVLHNAGSVLADIGSRAATVAAGDFDGDGDGDVVVGGIEGTETVVKILRHNGGGSFSIEELLRMAINIATPASPIYFPPPSISAANQTLDRPWGLALGDADADGDLDLWIGDRAFYVYLYRNDGSGLFTLQGGNTAVTGRPNVYVAHDAYRPAVGYTLSLAAGDVNGDARADLVVGLLNEKSGGTLSGLAHDGEIVLDTSRAQDGHGSFGLITAALPASDAGSSARGVAIADVNNDGLRDAIVGTWEGPIKLYVSQAPSTEACDDGDPCTFDACIGGACSHVVAPDGTTCSDGLFCTVNDDCQGAACLPGPARDCSDGVDCTLDSCNETVGCEHVPVNGACNDGNFCTEDSCDGVTGCASAPKSDGTPCDDTNVCTLRDACIEGTCRPGVDVPNCDDGNPCTDDSCDPAAGCVSTPNAAPCDDGNACTLGDTCGGGSCQPGPGTPDCDDANVCTADGCDPAVGCVSGPLTGIACDDGNFCTTGDTCLSGVCIGLSHANEPTPRTSGHYKRLCKGPHRGDQLTQADVECVNDTPAFSAVATLEDLCFVIEGPRDGSQSDEHDGECFKAESELMSFALNRCRARACDESTIRSTCGEGTTLTAGENFAAAGALIVDVAERTKEMCRASACLSREINNGHAFELDRVRADRSGTGGMVLSWDEPYLDDGAVHPTMYEIYRQVIEDTAAALVKIGETPDRNFTDDTPGDFAYEIVAIAPETP